MTFVESNFPARDRLNSRLVRENVVTGPTSYTTGGDPLDPDGDLGMSEIFGVYGILTSGSAIRIPVLDYTNQTVRFFIPDTGAEVANGVDLSTFSGTLLFTGKG